MARKYGLSYSGSDLGRLVLQVEDSVDPTVDDDSTLFIIRFTRWINTLSQDEFVCIDPTAGAAVWKSTTTGGGGGGGGAVDSVFGRAGVVVAVAGDYSGSEITNDSGVLGTTISDALDQLEADMVALSALKVSTSRQIIAGTGLLGGGTLASDRTLSADFGTGAGKVTEGNDSRLSDARTPTAHKVSHQDGGSDEISVTGLSGLLADAQTPLAHEASHLPSGSDPLTTAAAGSITPGSSASVGTANSLARSDHAHSVPAFGSASGTFCQGNDTRLSDARTPTAHASTHLPSGGDSLATGAPSTLVVGGSNSAGTANALARQDHVHALPAFGTTAGTFCQGNDTRLVGVAKLATVWLADIAPASPSANDDECNGSSGAAIDAKWSDWAPAGATLAHTYNGRGAMELSQTSHATPLHQGIRQAIPNSEFAFAASIGGTIQGGQYTSIGIFVAGDIAGSPTTAAFLFLNQQWGVTNTFRVFVLAKWSNYTTFVANFGASASSACVPRFYRMRVNGTTVASDVSEDGKAWWQIDTQTAAFTPAYFGVAISNNNTGNTQIAVIDWFRVLGTGAGSSVLNATWTGGFAA